MHSFTDPDVDVYAKKFNLPTGDHAEADRASWLNLQRFLAGLFR